MWLSHFHDNWCRWHHPYGRKWRGTKKPLDESESGEWKSCLKLNIQRTKIMASGPITSWEIDGETVETVSDFIFWGAPKSLQGYGFSSGHVWMWEFDCEEGWASLERSLEEGMATHSSILPWRIAMDRGVWRTTVHGVAKSRTWLSD